MGVNWGLGHRIALGCAAALALAAGPLRAAAQDRMVDIPAQDASTGVAALARQLDIQILLAARDAQGARTRAVHGAYSPEETLRRMLRGSGLEPRRLRPDTWIVVPFLPSPAAGDARTTNSVGEVIVTAEKKEEKLRDAPLAVTVLQSNALTRQGQVHLADYFTSVPGMNLAGATGGQQWIVIRGLSTGEYKNPTVATVIDDVPIGSSSTLTNLNLTPPDLDPSEFSRIEILKGPQGTLYGASALGGTIRIVTQDPTASAFSGRFEVAGETVPGGGSGYTVRGSANIPLSDASAIRISAFDRGDPGYINNITLSKKDFASGSTYGGHVALLVAPAENFSVKLSALYQRTNSDGLPTVNSDVNGHFVLGDLIHTGIPGSDIDNNEIQLYSSTIKDSLFGVDIASVTGYAITQYHQNPDFSGALGSLGPSILDIPTATGVDEPWDGHARRLTQELRLSSTFGKRFEWMIGGYYSDENSQDRRTLQATDETTGAPVGMLQIAYDGPLHFAEYAMFANGTIHVTDKFDIKGGLRQSWYDQSYQESASGPIATPTSPVPVKDKASAFTYLINPEYKFNPNLMAYARLSTGYTIGGPDYYTGGYAPGLPTSYQPETSTNYELGMKGSLLEHKLAFDFAIYHIAWDKLQTSITTPVNIDGAIIYEYYVTNAGAAKSDGAEFSVEYRPFVGLTFKGEGSYDYAVLTQTLPASSGYAPSGTPLPYSATWQGGFGISHEFSLGPSWSGVVGGDVNYTGPRWQDFSTDATTPRQRIPGFTTLRLHAAVYNGPYEINLYMNNATNVRGITVINAGFYLGQTGGSATIIQPRTIGLSVARHF